MATAGQRYRGSADGVSLRRPTGSMGQGRANGCAIGPSVGETAGLTIPHLAHLEASGSEVAIQPGVPSPASPRRETVQGCVWPVKEPHHQTETPAWSTSNSSFGSPAPIPAPATVTPPSCGLRQAARHGRRIRPPSGHPTARPSRIRTGPAKALVSGQRRGERNCLGPRPDATRAGLVKRGTCRLRPTADGRATGGAGARPTPTAAPRVQKPRPVPAHATSAACRCFSCTSRPRLLRCRQARGRCGWI
jgi:hypothetical protein